MSRTADIGIFNYPPGTRWDLDFGPFPVDYDLTGKDAVMEFAVDGVVVYRVNSGESGVTINDQTAEVRLEPSTTSVDFNDVTFESMYGNNRTLRFNLDIEESGLTTYRIQGILRIQPEHGDTYA